MTVTQNHDLELWFADKAAFGWEMPRAAWWKRLPVIRHIRCAWHSARVSRRNYLLTSVGRAPTGYDNWMLFGMWHGFERSGKGVGK